MTCEPTYEWSASECSFNIFYQTFLTIWALECFLFRDPVVTKWDTISAPWWQLLSLPPFYRLLLPPPSWNDTASTMMDAAGTSETSVNLYQSVKCLIPLDRSLQCQFSCRTRKCVTANRKQIAEFVLLCDRDAFRVLRLCSAVLTWSCFNVQRWYPVLVVSSQTL